MNPENTGTNRLLWESLRDTAYQRALKNLRLASDVQRNSEHSIHAIRVGIKRLRAWWRLTQPLVRIGEMHGADQNLKQASRALNIVRDNYVLQKTLEKLAGKISDAVELAVINKLLHRMSISAADSIIDWSLVESLLRQEVGRLQRLSGPDLAAEVDIYSWTGLRRTYRRAQRLTRRAIKESATAEERHRCRRWLKHLLYQVQFLDDIKIVDAGRIISRLNVLCRILGDYHDLVVLREALNQVDAQLLSGVEVQVLVNQIELEKKYLIRRFRSMAPRVFHRRTKKFVKRITN